jgi:membrane associated rhomboid family serine protease
MEVVIFLLFYIGLNIFLSSLTVPFPLSDTGTVRYNTTPYMTAILILLNVVIFAFWLGGDWLGLLSARNEFEATVSYTNYTRTMGTYGFRHEFLTEAMSIGAFTSFTGMFMHAEIMHILGNMIFLWAFGRRVEDACGPWRFLVFYLLAGTVSNIGSALLITVNGDVPMIGASGAIFGVMGAYLLLFPTARMDCLWVPAMVIKVVLAVFGLRDEDEKSWRWTVRLPAIFVVVLYVGFNIFPTFETAQTGELEGYSNYIAHMTGFLSAIVIFLFVRKDLLTRYFSGRAI